VTVIAALLMGASGFVAGRFIQSPQQVAAEAAPPVPSLITAEVVQQRLSSTVITRGTVSALSEVNIGYGMLVKGDSGPGGEVGGASGILTAMHVRPGDQIRAGGVLAEVSGRPIILLPGSRVMYRDMAPGATGPDVLQLNQALDALGYLPGRVTESFGWATQQGLTSLYRAAGYAVATTDGGSGEDAKRVAAAQSAVTAAERNLAKLKEPVASEGAVPPAAADIRAAEDDVASARTALDVTKAMIGVIAPQREIQFIPELPANVVMAATDVGFATPAVIARVTTSDLEVVATVAASQAGLLAEGTPVEIQLPDQTTVTGAVSGIAWGDTSTRQVHVRLDAPLDYALARQDVKVTFTAAQTAGEVLAVPPGALSSSPSGALRVTVVGADRALIPVEVTVGVHADGLVEINPVDAVVNPGDLVVIGAG